MEMRGYVYNTADPDLLINFNGKLQQKTQVTQAPPAIGPYYGYRSGFYGGWPGYGWGDTVYQYTEGTLNIDLVDARRKQLVWEGVAVGEVRNPRWPHRSRAWKKAVAQVFSKYPFRAGVAAPQGPDKSSLEESRMSTARRPASARPPADTDSPAARPRPPRPTLTARAAPPPTPAAHLTRSPWCCRAAALGPTRPGCTRACMRPASAPTGWRAFPSVRSTPPSSPLARGRARGAAARVLGDDLPADRFRRPGGDTLAGMFEGIPFGFGSPAMNGQLSAFHALVSGQPGFFKPRFPPPYLLHGQGRLPPASTTRLRWPIRCASSSTSTCERGQVRASFGVVNVRTGNFAYFDSRKDRLGPEHVMASGALPPGFPSVEIDGESITGTGAWCPTPAGPVVGAENMRDTLAFQVDLWPARGGLPTSLEEVAERQKDIQYSSRTRLVTDQLRRVLKLRHGLQKLARLRESERGAADPKELRRLSHAGDQHRQPDLRVQAPRALFQGLRVRHRGHARALGVRSVGHPPDPGPAWRAGPSDRGQLFVARHPSQRKRH